MIREARVNKLADSIELRTDEELAEKVVEFIARHGGGALPPTTIIEGMRADGYAVGAPRLRRVAEQGRCHLAAEQTSPHRYVVRHSPPAKTPAPAPSPNGVAANPQTHAVPPPPSKTQGWADVAVALELLADSVPDGQTAEVRFVLRSGR